MSHGEGTSPMPSFHDQDGLVGLRALNLALM